MKLQRFRTVENACLLSLCLFLDARGSAAEDVVAEALASRPGYDGRSTDTMVFDRTFRKTFLADRQADAAWMSLRTPEEIGAHRARLREKTVAALGGFPDKTPLNVRSCGRFARDGYVVERLVFESRPKHFVTALLFLPDAPAFQAPYPGVVVTCGHDLQGKNSKGNQRACVVLAKAGLASLIYDPVDQGERIQLPETKYANVAGHNNAGLRAHLVGWGAAQFRIWDGIRALDVLADGLKDDTYLYYADIVPGAALSYDWTELVGKMPLKGAQAGARMARFLNRKSQRRYRLKFADTYYGELNHYGMYWLKWADVRR